MCLVRTYRMTVLKGVGMEVGNMENVVKLALNLFPIDDDIDLHSSFPTTSRVLLLPNSTDEG